MIAKAHLRQREMRALIENKFNLIPSGQQSPSINPLVEAAFNGKLANVQELLGTPTISPYLTSPLDAACLIKNKKIASLISDLTRASITPYQATQLLSSNEVNVLIDWGSARVKTKKIPSFLTGLYQFCKSYGYQYKNAFPFTTISFFKTKSTATTGMDF